MLVELRIKNFAIINDISIEFTRGLNILSGETGAGKSIIVDALSIALGARADQEIIRTGQDLATIEAFFDVTHNETLKNTLMQYNFVANEQEHLLIIRRVISKNGKNKIYINGHSSTRILLAKITSELVQMSSQHEHQSLLNTEKQLFFIDEYCQNKKLLSKFGQSYSLLKQAFDQLVIIKISDNQKSTQAEFLRYQIREIEEASLEPGEDTELENKRNRLKHSQKLLEGCHFVENSLYSEQGSIYQQLNRVLSSLKELNQIDKEFGEHQKSLEDLTIQVEETAFFIRNYFKNLDHDPAVLDSIEERLMYINRLKKKYGTSLEGILDYLENSKKESDSIVNKEQLIRVRLESFKEQFDQTLELAFQLSENRRENIEVFEKRVEEEMHQVGLKNASFYINIKRIYDEERGLEFLKELESTLITSEGEEEGASLRSKSVQDMTLPFASNGLEKIEFLISTNKGENMKPLFKVVSGGELSRIMLSIKNVSRTKGEVGIYIFDEVDTGLGGAIAEVVGRKLKTISSNNQVICITHLPQVAVFSDNHIMVSKKSDSTSTKAVIKKLSRDERVQEISRMLAGINITDTTIDHARELVRSAEAYKPSEVQA